MKAPRFGRRLDGQPFSLSGEWFKAYGLPKPEDEVRFHPTRRWRFDHAWPEAKVALEIEGAHWRYGRHQRPYGFQEDCIKYSWAAILGWCVIRATTDMIRSGDAANLIVEALAARSKPRLQPSSPRPA